MVSYKYVIIWVRIHYDVYLQVGYVDRYQNQY